MPIGGRKRPDASKIQLSSNSYSNGVPISQYQNISPSINWERYQDSLDNMEYASESESESEYDYNYEIQQQEYERQKEIEILRQRDRERETQREQERKREQERERENERYSNKNAQLLKIIQTYKINSTNNDGNSEFNGNRPGYIFTTIDGLTGYYIDTNL